MSYCDEMHGRKNLIYVESEADLARMRLDEHKYKEVIELMDNLSTKRSEDDRRTKYHHIPFLQNGRFSGQSSSSTKSIALFGMGGVGKTQLALQYAHESVDKYDIILWVAADNVITIGQSLRGIAQGLQLCQSPDEIQDSAAAIWKVAWPGNSHGSILLTTRDFDVANNPAARCLQVGPFDDAEGSVMLLEQIGLDPKVTVDMEHATAITQTLGGLPLALSQIVKDDYEHTLSTVWDVSFQKLPKDATKLLNILIFLDPDAVDEAIFLEGSQTDLGIDPDFEFVADEMDLGDAEQPLLQAALINKTMEKPVITVHRLIQFAAIRRLPLTDQPRYLDVVVQLLSWGFPDTWSKDVGHQINAWQKCEKCLPHIGHLAKISKKHNVKPTNVQQYAELLLRSSCLVDSAVQTFQDKSTLAYASAIDLAGLIDLDLCRPELALKPFQEALEIRKKRLGPEDPFIAFSLNNIALAYTEMGKLEEAYSTHQQAIDIRLRNNSDRNGNSYSNMASLLLRMGKPDGAEEMLARCPSLKDFTDETFLSTGNPRFSGDMVLLSRIRLKQGRVDDALRLASKALAFRQKLLGNRLKTCDSLYDVANILDLQSHSASAVEFLKQLVDISESLSEGEGQLARALYKLSVLYAAKEAVAESDTCKARALEIRDRLRLEDKEAPFEEEYFSKLTLWMLW
ncbi:TPR-like protein [Hypoxylon trugodes]|uniref:TPR-like protein n=1 Tax=Hypoxylon trugodes TaxID=326681 RepID=UPI002199B131|nr:TPR-like protein [Hypoxylon trugodes]KAI1391090.1 TPR-like protein [Hypoxylon trugodes]